MLSTRDSIGEKYSFYLFHESNEPEFWIKTQYLLSKQWRKPHSTEGYADTEADTETDNDTHKYLDEISTSIAFIRRRIGRQQNQYNNGWIYL
mmetsp:Transcript_30922/g.33239  ORF Transcript_30922/g.33239 Transcript_30922/m.33239 type:complete len:92 (+) Transcript_30922:42-317(+)